MNASAATFEGRPLDGGVGATVPWSCNFGFYTNGRGVTALLNLPHTLHTGNAVSFEAVETPSCRPQDEREWSGKATGSASG